MLSSELYLFTARCLTLDEKPDHREEIKNTLNNYHTLDRFIQLCSEHLILPAIYLKFRKHNLFENWPDEYSEHLREIHQLNHNRNLELLKQIDKINTMLAKADIKPVYLKGTAHLQNGLYSDIGERMIGDIDFLVQEKDYLKSAQVLINNGYKSQTQHYCDLTTLKHYPPLSRADVVTDVEIHRLAVNIEYTSYFSSKIIFKQKRKINNKTNCFVQSNEHAIIQNFIHSQLVDKGHLLKQFPLRSLYDFYLLSKKTDLKAVLRKTEAQNKASDYFLFAKEIFDISNPLFPIATPKNKRFYTITFYF